MSLAFQPSARAWTDAHVTSAGATIEVQEDGFAEVEMRVSVRVLGGWLEMLEVVTEDREVEYLRASALMTSLEEEAHDSSDAEETESETEGDAASEPSPRGPRYRPRVEVDRRDEGSVLRFRFERSPRRGEYELRFRYRTDMARSFGSSPSGDVRLHWVFPEWNAGVGGVEVSMLLPGEAEPEALEEGRGSVRVERPGDATRVVWRRIHLPRTHRWELNVDVDAERFAGALSRRDQALAELFAESSEGNSDSRATDSSIESVEEEPDGDSETAPAPATTGATPAVESSALRLQEFALACFALVLLLGLREKHAAGALVLNGKGMLRSTILLALAASAAMLSVERGYPFGFATGLFLLAVLLWPRRSALSSPRLGKWTAVSFRKGVPEVGGRELSPKLARGLVTSLALLALGVGFLEFFGAATDLQLGEYSLLASVTAAFALRVKEAPASDHAERLSLLKRLAELPWMMPCPGLRLVAHQSASGEVQDVRLRLGRGPGLDGVLRTDLVVASRGTLIRKASICGVALVRQGSPAEARARSAFGPEKMNPGPGGRLAFIVSAKGLVDFVLAEEGAQTIASESASLAEAA